MALQDLTPRLRTRLSRVERVVGWFVLLAALLLATGFGYYLWHTAQRKGWFVEKVVYQTCLKSASGIKVGDPVKMMGFTVGEVTRITPNAPSDQWYAVTIDFYVRREPVNYPGYIWTDSKVRVNSTDLLGNRVLEITKGFDGAPTLLDGAAKTNQQSRFMITAAKLNLIKAIHSHRLGQSPSAFSNEIRELVVKYGTDLPSDAVLCASNVALFYVPYAQARPVSGYLEPDESVALAERADKLVTQVEQALPNILNLTNQVAAVLSNAVQLTSNINHLTLSAQPALAHADITLSNASQLVTNFNRLADDVRPVLTNAAALTAQLRQGDGALGKWLLPTNLSEQLDQTLAATRAAIARTDTNLNANLLELNRSLNNLGEITSNLNAQVQANTNMLSGISSLVTNTDHMVQGLKRHWLLRSAFKTNAPPAAVTNRPAVRTWGKDR